ncbi:unnamed protein product [marine sediment metagenome]|uniref:DUF35 domain-containing protein n=1 Tax=marine sediment metagenome TaxID=412755 RepID=X1FAK1_9ZZZZ
MRMNLVCLLMVPFFKSGDLPPSGYLDWHEWARVQLKGGLKQRRCPKCKLWRFPQEFPCKCEAFKKESVNSLASKHFYSYWRPRQGV